MNNTATGSYIYRDNSGPYFKLIVGISNLWGHERIEGNAAADSQRPPIGSLRKVENYLEGAGMPLLN